MKTAGPFNNRALSITAVLHTNVSYVTYLRVVYAYFAVQSLSVIN